MDMKTTNLEEMRIAMETYYEEVCVVGQMVGAWEATLLLPRVELRPVLAHTSVLGQLDVKRRCCSIFFSCHRAGIRTLPTALRQDYWRVRLYL